MLVLQEVPLCLINAQVLIPVEEALVLLDCQAKENKEQQKKE